MDISRRKAKILPLIKAVVKLSGASKNDRTAPSHKLAESPYHESGVAEMKCCEPLDQSISRSLPSSPYRNGTLPGFPRHPDAFKGIEELGDELETLDTTVQTASRSFLLNLPTDLVHHLVKYYLPFATILSLRLTCKALASVIPFSFLQSHRGKLIDLYLAHETRQRIKARGNRDTLPAFNRLYMGSVRSIPWNPRDGVSTLRCYGCLKLKPATAFTENMTLRGLSLGGRQARARLCKVCMVDRGRVKWGGWESETWIARSEIEKRHHNDRKGKSWLRRRWGRLFSSFDILALDQELDRGNSIPRHRSSCVPDSDFEVDCVDPYEIRDAARVGVCARCKFYSHSLYWGCVACFEKEQERLQEDAVVIDTASSEVRLGKWAGIPRKILALKNKLDNWWASRGDLRLVWVWQPDFWVSVKRFKTRRRRRRARKSYEERRRRLRALENSGINENIRSRGLIPQPSHSPSGSLSTTGVERHTIAATSAQMTLLAEDLVKAKTMLRHNVNRREIRCISCWTPDSPICRWSLGLAIQPPLCQERWCHHCRREAQEAERKRLEKKERTTFPVVTGEGVVGGLEGVTEWFA